MTATIRTFRANDAASALQAVKAALGPEAVIIDTRTVGTGLFRRPEVEVTAALEAPPERAPALPPAPIPPPERFQPARIEDPLADEVLMLRRAVEETRQALALVIRESRVGREMQLPPAAAELYSRLVIRGMEATLAEELVRQAAVSPVPRSSLLETVRDLVAERLVPCRAPWLHEQRHIIALVGPTGVGKTTTIAKMAARALLESRRRVALVTIDTYRVGASEQLARYGAIMDVPVSVARDRAELARAMERNAGAHLVLIDTAGRSNPEEASRQAGLVRSVRGVQLHLVVSAATGALDLASVAERYRTLAPDRLIFTKLDEAAGPGGLLSAAVRVGRPIACVADGQRVPEDLHALSGQQLVDLVVGSGSGPRD
jgi:flagellar biosynthesis protein FlhF